MSAKELTIFLPESTLNEIILNEIARGLSLVADQISSALNLSYQFFAKRGSGRCYVAVEYKNDDLNLIREVVNWEHPSNAYKAMLRACKSSITIYYREQRFVEDVVLELGAFLKTACTSPCIVENGRGCLLRLDDLLDCLKQEPKWSWDREEFPELPGVAASEWK